jgi:hypothetical protein
MNWIVIAVALLAQSPSSPDLVAAKAEIARLESLVAAGAVAPARLIEARHSLADAEDAATLARTLYARIALQDFTEAQGNDMLAAAKRRVARQTERIEHKKQLIEAGVASRTELQPLLMELESRNTVVKLATGRARLLNELVDMARAEELAASLAAEEDAASIAARGGPIVEFFQGSGKFNDGDMKRITLEFEKEFSKPLPVSAKGESAVHKDLGFDHRGRVDVGVSPDSEEGQWMRRFLAVNRIPYIAFRRSIAGQATAPHIHIGTPSPRIAPAD